MADQAHEWTDEQIERLQRRFRREFSQASREMGDKLAEQMEDYDRRNREWQQRVSSGKSTQDEYDAWLKDRAADRRWMQDMVSTLSQSAARADQLAIEHVNDELPHIFAENANRAAFEVESGIGFDTHSFDLYDQDTVRRLIAEQPELLPPMPEPKFDNGRDLRWNRQKFSSAITQSILQGESIPDAAKRISLVMRMNENSAVRAARTAITGAENAGRVHSYERAKRIGIDLEQQWMATLDMRTRHSHRQLDGQRVPVGGKFKVDGIELEYPGDPTAPGEYVYNCRCTLVAWFPDIEQEDPDRFTRLPKDMTYEKWKEGKKQEQKEYKYTSGSSQMWGQVGDNDPIAVRKKVDQMLQGAAGNAAEVWRKYESQFKLFDPEGTDGDYFMAGRGVSVHLANDMEGNGVQGNVMGVFFHEFGHHIDNIVDHIWGASNIYGRGDDEHGLFPSTLVREVSAAVERKREETARRLESAIKNIDIDELVNIGAVNRVEQASAIFDVKQYLGMLDDDLVDIAEEDLGLSLSGLSMDERRKSVFDYYRKNGLSISMPDESELGYRLGLDITDGGHDMQIALGDIYEGATKGVVFDTFGHGVRYWGTANDGRLAEEAFAEFFSAECIYSENPRVLDIMKEYLPESYSVYREIMESIA